MHALSYLSNTKMTPIPTYIINLESRADRKHHSIRQFEGRAEFDFGFVNAEKAETGSLGLWNTIKNIVSNAILLNHEYILICEDDHEFTAHYATGILLESISKAKEHEADLLLGGVSSVHSLFKVTETLVWVEGFTGAQFTIIFRKFFDKILKTEFLPSDNADYKYASISSDIFLIYPFISIQKDFGYSDVTIANHLERRVDQLFKDASEAVSYVLDSQQFYGFDDKEEHSIANGYVESEMVIPVYVINLPERSERLQHIKKQFEGKEEFEVTYVEACKNVIGAVGLWESIRKVIQMGIEKEDSVLVICEDDHLFTDHYCREILFRNIIAAHRQGCDILSAGTSGGFGHALPIGKSRYWVNHFLATQFIVVYRKFFNKILEAPYDQTVTADYLLSELTCNKMVIHPFLSTQKDFGYSDVTSVHNEREGMVAGMFNTASRRLDRIRSHYRKLKLINTNA